MAENDAAPKSKSTPSPHAAPYPPIPRYLLSGGGGGGGGVKRPLFGGALSVRLPSPYRDVSDVREVPDHQEVWQDCGGGSDGGGAAGQCAIVEILSYQDEVGDGDAGRFFFDDLADANGATAANPGGRRRVTWAGTAMVGVREAKEDEGDSDDAGSPIAANADGADDGKEARPSHVNLLPYLNTRTVASLCVGYQRIAKGRDFDLSGRSRSSEQVIEWVRVELCAVRLRRIMTDLLVTLSTPVGVGEPPGEAEKVEEAVGDGEPKDVGARFSADFRSILGSLTVHDWSLFA